MNSRPRFDNGIQDSGLRLRDPRLYVALVWGPTGIAGGFSPSPRRTVQQFEMDDDLGDSNSAPLCPQYGGRAIPDIFRIAGAIWPSADSHVTVSIYADSPQQVDLQILRPGIPQVFEQSGQSEPNLPFATSFQVIQEGLHIVQTKLSNLGAVPARLYLKLDYLGPASSALF